MALLDAIQAVVDEMNGYRRQVPPDMPDWAADLYIESSRAGRERAAQQCEDELREACDVLQQILVAR